VQHFVGSMRAEVAEEKNIKYWCKQCSLNLTVTCGILSLCFWGLITFNNVWSILCAHEECMDKDSLGV